MDELTKRSIIMDRLKLYLTLATRADEIQIKDRKTTPLQSPTCDIQVGELPMIGLSAFDTSVMKNKRDKTPEYKIATLAFEYEKELGDKLEYRLEDAFKTSANYYIEGYEKGHDLPQVLSHDSLDEAVFEFSDVGDLFGERLSVKMQANIVCDNTGTQEYSVDVFSRDKATFTYKNENGEYEKASIPIQLDIQNDLEEIVKTEFLKMHCEEQRCQLYNNYVDSFEPHYEAYKEDGGEMTFEEWVENSGEVLNLEDWTNTFYKDDDYLPNALRELYPHATDDWEKFAAFLKANDEVFREDAPQKKPEIER